jgi:hypothetical protein
VIKHTAQNTLQRLFLFYCRLNEYKCEAEFEIQMHAEVAEIGVLYGQTFLYRDIK